MATPLLLLASLSCKCIRKKCIIYAQDKKPTSTVSRKVLEIAPPPKGRKCMRN